MAGKGFETGARDQLDELQSQIEDLQAAVKRLENIKTPTVPIYRNFSAPNPGDLPDDPLEGQVAIGDDNIHRWYSSGAWHDANTASIDRVRRMPWIKLLGTVATPVTIYDHNAPILLGGAEVNFIGSLVNMQINNFPYLLSPGPDSAVYSVPLIGGGVGIRQEGTYYVGFFCDWYKDWGEAFISYGSGQDYNMEYGVPGDTLIFDFDSSSIESTAGRPWGPSYFPGQAGASHDKITLSGHAIVGIHISGFQDPIAFLSPNLHNLSGTDRTAVINAGFVVRQLTDYGAPSPPGF